MQDYHLFLATVLLGACFGRAVDKSAKQALAILISVGFVLKHVRNDFNVLFSLVSVTDSITLVAAGVVLGDALLSLLLCLSKILKLLLARFYSWWIGKPTGYRSHHATTPEHCQAITQAGNLSVCGLGKNTLKPHTARFEPNQPLIVAFGINNSFTTTDKDHSQLFRAYAMVRLRLDAEQWSIIAEIASASLAEGLTGPVGTTINLATLIQRVALKCVIMALFAEDLTGTEFNKPVDDLAYWINKQWIASKASFNPNKTPKWAYVNQHAFRSTLETLFPDLDPNDPENTPLNLILPAWETLWRVVLAGFIEVTSRGHQNAPDWRQALISFFTNPVVEQLEAMSENDISARMVVEETLRLYPPTRRVHRLYVDQEGRIIELKADIEAAHRIMDIWGDDSSQFSPKRWIEKQHLKDAEKDKIFMPFGSKPFMCPARYVQVEDGIKSLPFGVAMIGLIVGAAVKAVEGEHKWVVKGKLPATPRPLNSDREAHNHLVLRRSA